MPLLNKEIGDISSSLERLHANGLINWYEANGEKVIQIENFDKHQQGLHKRTKSKFPDFPGNSGNVQKIPSELKGTELNRTEEKGREQISPDGANDYNPYRYYENGFGTISPVISDNINDLSKEYGDMWLCKAMETAILRGKRNMKYVQGILKSWKADGIDEPWEQEKQSKGDRLSFLEDI
ncbi:MAG: DnaD domain-containing protein [Bacillota bacterium]